MLKKSFIGVALLSSVIYLNAEELVSLKDDSNLTQALSKEDSRKNDDIQFALELGAKTDFWNPGLSREDGQDILKYDTKGLYLGYATFRAKIYDTDVFTLEKFTTLTSSNSQKELLSEYKDDKKKESSVDGLKMSIQVMKILNYWFDSDILNGLEYKYQTRNFIGKAELQEDALYWFGEAPGALDIDYYKFEEGSELSFKTKFTDQRLLYNFTNKRVKNMNFFLGAFDSKWSKPVYIGATSRSGESVIFPAEYKIQGVALGLKAHSGNFKFKTYLDYGINNNMYLNNGRNLEDTMHQDDIDLIMVAYGLDMDFVIPKIYSNSYFDLNFIVGGKLYYSSMQANPKGDNNSKAVDEEKLYSIQTALEFTF